MKKRRILVFITFCIMILGFSLTGCISSKAAKAPDGSLADHSENKEGAKEDVKPAVTEAVDETADIAPAEAVTEDSNEKVEAPATEAANETEKPALTETADETVDNSDVTIVWLGDSLTQGSLGAKDDNLDNAPYVTLSKLSGANVEGFGYWGFNTHDILWAYEDESYAGQSPDPDKVYVFWCGSNDWVVGGEPNTDVEAVIKTLDDYISKSALNKYIVLGTTSRFELRNEEGGPDMSSLINEGLKAHYGDLYLDVDSSLSKEKGYVDDRVHLTQDSYDAIAGLVYDKLRALNYLK
ncbi:MAG: SGNH/GDSL hydrolase family protein [Lachnospiraceae bacterium]|nr:SGNH/GDSL hydrolase family protein [Lachnospiraceae bacterium]